MQQKICQVDVEGPVQKVQAVPNRPQKAKVGPAASNRNTLVDSAVTAYPLNIDHEEEWWRNTPLSELNTHGERLWFNSAHAGTNIWAGIR